MAAKMTQIIPLQFAAQAVLQALNSGKT